MTLHDQQREASLDKRRGHRPRLTAPGTDRRPALTLADRLLAVILHYRLALPRWPSRHYSACGPETVNKRIRGIRQLLDQAGHTIQPSPHRLASLDDLYKLARSTDIAIQPGIKRGSPETVETSVVMIAARAGCPCCARGWPGQAVACPLFLLPGGFRGLRGQGRPAGPSPAVRCASTLMEAGVAAPYA
jgi:hypothetical protein